MKKFEVLFEAHIALLVILLVAFWFGPVSKVKAVEWIPLDSLEAANKGATHQAIITRADFTVSTTNAIQAFTNSIPDGATVEFVAMLLDTPFSVGTTNWTESCLLKVGDGSDDDLFLASTELASDGTEVFTKLGPPNSYTITGTTLTNTFIYLDGSSNVTTNSITYISALTAAATAGELGYKYYSAAGSIVFTLTPNAEHALDEFLAGQVRCLFRVRERNK